MWLMEEIEKNKDIAKINKTTEELKERIRKRKEEEASWDEETRIRMKKIDEEIEKQRREIEREMIRESLRKEQEKKKEGD